MRVKCPLDKFIDKPRQKRKQKKLLKFDDERSSFLFSNKGRVSEIKPGSVFGKISTNVKRFELQTAEERKLKALERVKQQNQDICYLPESFHPYKGITAPKLVLKKRQEFSKSLITPRTRKAKHERDREIDRAKKLAEKTEAGISKREYIIATRYQQGILGFDSPEEGHSKYYKEAAAQHKRIESFRAAQEEKRKQLIAHRLRNTSFDDPRFSSGKKFVRPSSTEYTTSSFKKLFGTTKKLNWTRKKRDFTAPFREIDFVTNTIKSYSPSQVKSSPISE